MLIVEGRHIVGAIAICEIQEACRMAVGFWDIQSLGARSPRYRDVMQQA